MNRSRERSCLGKMEFSTRNQARDRLSCLKKDHDVSDRRLKVYKCNYCHLWHIGTKKRLRGENT